MSSGKGISDTTSRQRSEMIERGYFQKFQSIYHNVFSFFPLCLCCVIQYVCLVATIRTLCLAQLLLDHGYFLVAHFLQVKLHFIINPGYADSGHESIIASIHTYLLRSPSHLEVGFFCIIERSGIQRQCDRFGAASHNTQVVQDGAVKLQLRPI